MNEFNILSQQYRYNNRDLNTGSDGSTSPEYRVSRFSSSQVTSSSTHSKTHFKKELLSLKSLPSLDYKLHLNSLLSMMSTPYPCTSLSLSPKNKDSADLSPEKELFHSKTSNLKLKPLFSLQNLISRAGYKIHESSGRVKKHHQVGVIIKPSFHNIKGEYLFSLCEGHGPEGYKLVKFLKTNLVGILELHLHFDLESMPGSFLKIGEVLSRNFQDSTVNLTLSGGSLITLLVHGQTCFVCNIGTCKAVLAKFSSKWQCVELNETHDLKNENERQRILEFGGKIQRLENQNGETVERFDLNGCKSPRFESTRAIGFTIGKAVGISNRPDIFKFQIQIEDKFVIVASSALWKVISPNEALEIAMDGWDMNKTDICCDALVKEADKRLQCFFNEKFDISAVVFFINSG